MTYQQLRLDLGNNFVGYETMHNVDTVLSDVKSSEPKWTTRANVTETANVTRADITATANVTRAYVTATANGTRADVTATANGTRASQKKVSDQPSCDEDCEWIHLQESRKKRVHDTCEASLTKPLDFNSIEWSAVKKHFDHILVSDQYKLLYCYVPKVGCTNWKRIFLTLNGKVNASQVVSQVKTHLLPIPKLSDFSFQNANMRLQEYTKFLFTRNPHERLLSAYRDKLKTRNERNAHYRKHYGKKIYDYNVKKDEKYSKYLNNYPEENNLRRVKANGEFDVTFQEFIRYVSDPGNKLNEPPEEHWREIYRLCSPCSIQYDIIGKMETLENDTHFILTKSSADQVVEQLGKSTNPTNSSNESKIRDAFAQLTEKDLNQFERRFQKDLDLFDYQRPKAITKLKSEEDDRKERVQNLRTALKHPAPGERINVDIGKIRKINKPGQPLVKDYFQEEINDYYNKRQSESKREKRSMNGRIDNGRDRIRGIEAEVARHKQHLMHQFRHELPGHEAMLPNQRDSSMDAPPKERFRRFDRGIVKYDLYRRGRFEGRH